MISFLFSSVILIVCEPKGIYYVSMSGSDSSSCGKETSPCASINQIVSNYPGTTYTVSISEGSYATTSITLLASSFLTFQGRDNTFINATYRQGFIVNSQTSGFEFRDVTICLRDDGTNFATLNSENNYVVFYNVILTSFDYSGDFIDINGGSVLLYNFTFDGASFPGRCICDNSTQLATNISILLSTFSNINFQKSSTSRQGGMLIFGGYGTANVVVESSVFVNSSAFDAFIEILTEDVNQEFRIVNCLFSNVNASVPIVYFEIDDCYVIDVRNSTWNNIFSRIGCGALEILGSNDGVDHTVFLDELTFVNCTGSLAGALLVGYNSLLLSNSTFAGNSGQFGNDVVQGLGNSSSGFAYSITASYSSSDLPKAVVRNVDSGAITDISYLLPNPTNEPKVTVVNIVLRKEEVVI